MSLDALKNKTASLVLSPEHKKLMEGRLHDPFSILGTHSLDDGQTKLTVFAPHVETLCFGDAETVLQRLDGTDFFYLETSDAIDQHVRLHAKTKTGYQYSFIDPYSFSAQIPEYDLNLFSAGNHWHIYRYLGASQITIDGIDGTLFSTWAPNAERVSVVGGFNDWDGRRHPMRSRGGSGVWELFLPEIAAGEVYKFEILNRQTGLTKIKADPYGRQFEMRPKTAAIISPVNRYEWQDQQWMHSRQQYDWQHAPISIYEVHLGSWRRGENNSFLNYRELAEQLVEYLEPLGFTHIELLPISEHPLDQSWGYQVTGYYAPTSRFGTADDFRYFVDYLHRRGFGVILDWVPAHFPKDDWSLVAFDGEPLYEHEDPRRGEHKDWGTKIFNFGRNEVKNFLISNAFYWIEEFHLDGIRVDAVASLLYLDYSREEGEWLPNEYGGNENLEAIEFLKHLNSAVGSNHPDVLMIAEESTSWPQVSRPVYLGGLGFSMKWSLGWMNDTLRYFEYDPIHRRYHQNDLTFGMLYSHTENFILPFSHDEVVHGKRALLSKMPGDNWQKFANLRLLLMLQFTYPGKKLLFMGSEFGLREEWNENESLPWHYLEYDDHRSIQALVADLNQLYCENKALHKSDFNPAAFEWLDCNNADQSTLVFQRRCESEVMVAAFNFTPVPRHNYRIGLPQTGQFKEKMNSDSRFYGGTDIGNPGVIDVQPISWSGYSQSLEISLPPLGGVVFSLA